MSQNGDAQEVAPMARFLSEYACNGGLGNGNPSPFSGCLRHSLQATVVIAAEPSNPAENCSALRWGGTMALPSGGTYTFQDWRTVLRIVYAGQTQPPSELPDDPCETISSGAHPRSSVATKDCNGEIRRTLVNSWGNMFAQGDGTDCTNDNCVALRHAFRRDDTSSATISFLDLLALPPIGTGSSAPFCNGTETQDNDPVRRECLGNGFANGEQVCKPVRTTTPTTTNQGLGLVLPVLIPQANVNPPYVRVDGVLPLCSPNVLGGAFYGEVQMPIGAQCPYGGTPNPTCKWPKRTAGNDSFDCIAMRNDVPGRRDRGQLRWP